MRGAICDFICKTIHLKACCCEAGNGVAAIQKARERAPDLVIMDLNMPMLHGFEAASSLRDVAPHIKIVGLNMFDGESRESQLDAAGFDMIVPKQAGLGKLAAAINALLPLPPATN